MAITTLYLVRHAESCSNIRRSSQTRRNPPRTDNTYRITHNGVLHEPTLSIRGYIQSFQLRDYISNSKDMITYDKVICSPLIRTVITAMVSLSTFDNNKNTNVINIVPYVKLHHKKLSKINRVSELKEKIHNFTKWFHKTGIHIYQLYREVNSLSPENIRTIHFPRINYTELENYEHKFRENETINNNKEFRDYILRLHMSSVILFTHKRFIKQMCHIHKEPLHTSITKMVMDTENETNTANKELYAPSKRVITLTINRKYETEQCNTSMSFLNDATRRTRRQRIKNKE